MRHLAVGEALHVGRQIGMGLVAVPPRHPGQHEPPSLGVVRLGQQTARAVHPIYRLLEQLGKQTSRYRLDGHE